MHFGYTWNEWHTFDRLLPMTHDTRYIYIHLKHSTKRLIKRVSWLLQLRLLLLLLLLTEWPSNKCTKWPIQSNLTRKINRKNTHWNCTVWIFKQKKNCLNKWLRHSVLVESIVMCSLFAYSSMFSEILLEIMVWLLYTKKVDSYLRNGLKLFVLIKN